MGVGGGFRPELGGGGATLKKATYHADVNNIAPNTSGALVLVQDSGDALFDGGGLTAFKGLLSIHAWVKNSNVGAIGSALGTQLILADAGFVDVAILSSCMPCGLFPGLVDQDEASLAYVVDVGWSFLPSWFRGADGHPNFPSSNWQFFISQVE